MINTYTIIILALFILALLITHCLMLNWGIRIGKAMQKEPPPVPLAEPAQRVTEGIKRVGGKIVRLVKDAKELKALKKAEKEETSIYD